MNLENLLEILKHYLKWDLTFVIKDSDKRACQKYHWKCAFRGYTWFRLMENEVYCSQRTINRKLKTNPLSLENKRSTGTTSRTSISSAAFQTRVRSTYPPIPRKTHFIWKNFDPRSIETARHFARLGPRLSRHSHVLASPHTVCSWVSSLSRLISSL